MNKTRKHTIRRQGQVTVWPLGLSWDFIFPPTN